MGGLLSFILQKHFSILVLKYKKIQRGGGMNDFSQKQFSHHTVTHFNTDPPLYGMLFYGRRTALFRFLIA